LKNARHQQLLESIESIEFQSSSLTGRKTSSHFSPPRIAFAPRVCGVLVLSPLCAVTAEVSGVLVRTMVMNAGLELARFARLGGQSDHFK